MEAFLYRVILGASLLASTSCATVFPVDYHVLRTGDVPVGLEWIEIRCPDVIDTTRPEKELWLLLPQPPDVPDYREKVIVFRDGSQRVELFAEIVDSKGKAYPLPNWMPGAMGRGTGGFYMRLTSNTLPRKIQLAAVRLRSSHPITFREVLWVDQRTTYGPPNEWP